MRILFVLHFPLPFAGAGWTRIEFFIQYLANSTSSEISVLGAFTPKSLTKAGYFSYNGINIMNLTPLIMYPNILFWVFNILSSFFVSLAIFLLKRPDVVFVSLPTGESSLGVYTVGRIFGVKKIIFDIRDAWEDYLIQSCRLRINRKFLLMMKKIMAGCYCRCNTVITVTSVLVKKLNDRGVRNVVLLPNGVDRTVFYPYDRTISRSRLGISQEDLVIVYCGIVGWYYCFDFVLHALKILRSTFPNVQLVIIGSGNKLDHVIALSQILDLQENVKFMGEILDKQRVASVISAADFGIVPLSASYSQHKDALPVKVLEYLACGLPVVASVCTDSDLAKILIKHGVGVVSEPGNSNDLAAKIEYLYNNENFIIHAKKRSQYLVDHYFNRETTAQELSELLRESL